MSEDNGGTTETDYRWRWLSTLWALVYGIGFPAALLSGVAASVSAPVMGTFTLAWGGTVVYVIGPENVKAWKSLRGA